MTESGHCGESHDIHDITLLIFLWNPLTGCQTLTPELQGSVLGLPLAHRAEEAQPEVFIAAMQSSPSPRP